MKRQSRTYFELEQLVHAIESLSAWRGEEQKYVGIPKKPRGVPQPLKKLKDALTLDMEPILEGILLNPVNEEEAEDLRTHPRHVLTRDHHRVQHSPPLSRPA